MTIRTRILELTTTQRTALDAIAVNDDGSHHPATLKALERRGLIESYPEGIGRDVLGPIVITRYFVPLPVHIAWAELCSEAVTKERKP